MNRFVFILFISVMLTGCKLGGQAEGVSQPLTIIDLNTKEAISTRGGRFEFQYDYQPGDAYSLSLSYNTTYQDCTMTGGRGVFGEVDIFSVQIECQANPTGLCPAAILPICYKQWSSQEQGFKYHSGEWHCARAPDDRMVAFDDECGALNDQPAGFEYPVVIGHSVTSGSLGSVSDDVQVLAAAIWEDILELQIEYSGCLSDPVRLVVLDAFEETAPPTAATQLHYANHSQSDLNDVCSEQEALTKTVRSDLLPVKEMYRRQYGESGGRVRIADYGVYSFE